MASTKKAAVPELIKLTLSQRTQQLINDKFKVSLPLQAEAAKNHGFNYIVDIYTMWRGRYLYLIAKYRNPRGDASTEYFEVRTTRMEYIGGQRFNLAYMRHTEQWCEVFQSLTMAECLDTIEKNEMFWPVH